MLQARISSGSNCILLITTYLDVFCHDENDEFPVVAHEEECWHCNSCVLDCPDEAVSLRIPLPAMMLYVDAVKEGK